jgi:hypothetical protein
MIIKAKQTNESSPPKASIASIKKISFGACISTYGCMLRFFDPERPPRECGTLTVY